MIARAETVHVKSITNAYIHVMFQYFYGAGKVASMGDFQVILVAVNDADGDIAGAGHFDIIGGGTV